MATRDINELQYASRFLDVDDEPHRILPSIQGYEDTPLVSLNRAIIPLPSIVRDIQKMVQIVKVNGGEPAEGLSRDESDSIRLFLLEWQPKETSVFYVLNNALRSKNRDLLQPWFLFLRLISIALSHLPSTPMIVYRGFNMDLSPKYRKGETAVWWGFSSCMKKSNQLEKRLFLNKAGKRTLFRINCYSAKEIHRHSMYEGEVLLPPACQFEVVDCVDRGKGLHIVELREIQPVYQFLTVLSRTTNSFEDITKQNIQFQPISTVSLSKRSLPAALPNPKLEERLAYFFKPRSKVELNEMSLADSDMDIVVSEILIKRHCLELNLSENRITPSGILILAHELRKNKEYDIVLTYRSRNCN